ncbi:MAG: hypothetical protein J2P47_07390 [Acetobacteraceae bacterium]|nr:hypothetical protein [Acetobacteraceae bacterium]
MAKSMRRGGRAIAPTLLADRGAEAMRHGRFKAAIDVYKQLARQDPQPCWRERLSDAYAGRARDLADKGMFKDAAIVLENTQTPDGAVREPALYLICLINQGQHEKAARIAVNYVEGDRGMASAGPVAEIAAALSLITPIPARAIASESEWAAGARAAHAALDAWLGGKPACEVESLLTHVRLHSPFGSLRLILKCLVMRQDAPEKAIELLKRIRPESVFGGMRVAVEAANTQDASALLAEWDGLSAEQRAFVAEIRGLPGGATESLSRILAAERAGPAALFALLIKPGLPMPDETLRAACLDLLALTPGVMDQFERRFGPLSRLERSRALALSAEAQEKWREARHHWEAVVTSLSGPEGSEARLAQGVVLRHLADLAERHVEVEVGTATDAVAHYLARSVEADPDNLPVTLRLIEHYRDTGDGGSFQRLADEAALRSPQNSAILLHAVDGAVARKSYKKAARFARQLLQLDPINQPVRQRMIELQLAQARKQMRASRADLAMKALSQAAEWERSDMPNPALRIGHALVGYGEGNPASEVQLEQAVTSAGGGTVGWFRAVLEAALMGWTDRRRQPLHRELAATLAIEPRRDEIMSLIAVLAQPEVRESKRVVSSVLWRIDQWLLRGASLAWSDAEFETIAVCLQDFDAFEAVSTYAAAAIRRNPDGTVARFYRIVAQTRGESDRLSKAQIDAVLELLDDAEDRHDPRMAGRIRSFLEGGTAARPRASRMRDELGPHAVPDFVGLGAAIADSLPEKELRKIVHEFGRGPAIAILADIVGDSPLAEILTEQQIAFFCGELIARAVGGGRRATVR